MSDPTPNALPVMASSCCAAPTRVGGDDTEGTHYAVCTACGQPCDTRRGRSSVDHEQRALRHELLARLESAEDELAKACGQAKDLYPDADLRFSLGQARFLTISAVRTVRGELA